MLNYRWIISNVALAWMLVGCANAPARFTNGVMTDSAGMTLYTFDKDSASSGKSVCNGPCSKNWPPLAAKTDDKAAGYWTIVVRDDGSRQWAYKGKPVYLWVKDSRPGDKTGEGVANAWHTIAEDAPATRSGNGY